MACNDTANIHRYHDGELSATEQEVVAAHLGHCAECRRLLADLQGLSAMIAGAPLTAMPSGLEHRLLERTRAVGERGVLRLAGWLTATAAAVLIASLLTQRTGVAEDAFRPSIWETVAVMPPEAHEGTSPELLATAQWIVDELELGQNGNRK